MTHPKANKLILTSLRTHLLLLGVLFLNPPTIVDARQPVPPNQCPLRVPSEVSTTNVIDLNNRTRPPLVTIGHRGSSYNLPEHTLAGYRLALELGADYIEPDLVSTKDGKLVAVHSLDLNITTDVSTKFPDRFRDIVYSEGQEPTSAYLVQDFTLEEIKTLRVKQRLEDTDARSRYFDWVFPIPTFHEIIDLLYEWNVDIRNLIGTENRKVGGRPGLYVELKKSRLLREDADIHLRDLFIEELKTHPNTKELFFGDMPSITPDDGTEDDDDRRSNIRYLEQIGATNNSTTTTTPTTNFGCERSNEYQVPPLVVQSFDIEDLNYVRNVFHQDEGNNFNHAVTPMVLLVSRSHCEGDGLWYGIGDLIISGIGPDKECLLNGGGKNFMINALKNKLAVHPWTERLENEFMDRPTEFKTAEEELRYMYCELGIHGIFAENVDIAVRVGYRGCDDFKSPEELIKEEIKEEEKNGNEMDEEKICSETSQQNITIISLACTSIGLILGALISHFVTARIVRKRGHHHLPTGQGSGDDDDMEML